MRIENQRHEENLNIKLISNLPELLAGFPVWQTWILGTQPLYPWPISAMIIIMDSDRDWFQNCINLLTLKSMIKETV